jgi:hypothetical protein
MQLVVVPLHNLLGWANKFRIRKIYLMEAWLLNRVVSYLRWEDRIESLLFILETITNIN